MNDREVSNPIRVMLVEDHELTRDGLIALLNGQPDIDVVGDVATVTGALEAVTSLAPDVAIIDLRLPDGNGLNLCQRIRTISPQTQCIIHTSDEIGPETAKAAGAAAVVVKQLRGNQLINTIRKTAAIPDK